MATEYCDRQDVADRLTAQGYKWAADLNRSGAVSESEAAATIDAAIRYAGGEIDAAIIAHVDPDHVRGAQVDYLKDLSIDLASYRAVTTGGRKATAQLTKDYEDARAKLTKLEAGALIPGLTYPIPANTYPSAKWPQTYNLKFWDQFKE